MCDTCMLSILRFALFAMIAKFTFIIINSYVTEDNWPVWSRGVKQQDSDWTYKDTGQLTK